MQNRILAVGLFALLATLCGTPIASAAQRNLEADQLLAQGLDAYNRGNDSDAREQLTAAIAAGVSDPRAYYFRGLAAAKLGRSVEAEADFIEGARLEAAQAGHRGEIGRSLQRVQGSIRLTLENYRSLARAGQLPERLRQIAQTPVEPVQPKLLERKPIVVDEPRAVAKATAPPTRPKIEEPKREDIKAAPRPEATASTMPAKPETVPPQAPETPEPAIVAAERVQPAEVSVAIELIAPAREADQIADRQLNDVPSVKTSKIEQTPSDSGFGLDLGRLLEGISGGNLPGNMAYLRVSQRYLQQLVAGEYHQQSAVNDNVLGTLYSGTSDTRGLTTVSLIPDERQARIELRFKGSSDFWTSGPSRNVCLHSHGTTCFDSCKLLSIDGAGPHLTPACTQANTCYVTDQITTCARCLRGRVSVRVAWRREAKSHADASAAISRNSERTIGQGFDQAIGKELESLTRLVSDQISQLPPTHDLVAHGIHCHTTAEAVYFALLGPGAREQKFVPAPKLAKNNPDVELHVHSALVSKAVTDPQMAKLLQSAAGSLFTTSTPESPSKQAKENKDAAAPGGLPVQFYWSPDHAWLTIVWNAPRSEK